MSTMNRQWVLAARPTGMVKETDFNLVESPILDPNDEQVLLRTLYLTVDPYMRGRMSDRKSYAEPVPIGAVMTGEVVARVEKSKHAKFAEGDLVTASLGWQEFGVSDGNGLRKLDPSRAPVSTALHVLGMPGLTAYFGLLEICKPKTGQTVVVSGAAGAVGSVVGQIAKIKGCRVVGIVGSDDKANWLTQELGFDDALNYKTTDNYYKNLKRLCPDGVHAYFDNVGGPITDAIFPLLSIGARIAICGQISQYNLQEAATGPRLLWNLIVKRALVQGFLVFDFKDQYRDGLKQLTEWLSSGQLKYRESIAEGIENAASAFIGLFQGSNVGKQLVKVSDL